MVDLVVDLECAVLAVAPEASDPATLVNRSALNAPRDQHWKSSH
jgi:hypothetical protein